MTYRVVSFFSGCGGMDLGLLGGFDFLGNSYQKHDVKILKALDIDPKAVNLYNLNFEHKSDVESILDVEEEAIPEHDIMLGGFPCQSFSIVAQNPKRLGYKDEKGKLFFEMCRILKAKKPAVFIAENVKGILSANKGMAFELILSEFQKVGYHVKYTLLNASHFGVPQKRERVFIVGFRDKESFDAFSFPSVTTLLKPIPISKIIEEEIEEKYYFSDKAVEGLYKTKHISSMNKGRVQDLNNPCNTVAAHLAKISLNSTDPVLNINGRYRMFTPREVARIQSFPESFQLVSSRVTNYKALGNAVPPVLMWHIGNAVVEALASQPTLALCKAM
jgi:DNA (cytosine-5)-methyltransferase 1